ncbi:MAG: type I-U CRISPR-associated protein Cas5/Cas6 [Myxococcales bacterium]|nr:type I-U CRISPR-associated protein Cas5/Cas6 [Myxococcales bacterium]
MIEVEIDFLAERYTASAYNDRNETEWPPHPARLFSALVATWAEDEGEDPENERAALEWLEQQPPPWVVASECTQRKVVPVFVPVNDTGTVDQPLRAREMLAEALASMENPPDGKTRVQLEKAVNKAQDKLKKDTQKAVVAGKRAAEKLSNARQILPESRLRQSRTFPTVIPVHPRVRYIWKESPSDDIRLALEALCQRVLALGHSSSFIRASIKDPTKEPDNEDTYEPDLSGRNMLRVTTKGQLQRLEQNYQQHKGIEPRILPAEFRRYRRGAKIDKYTPPTSVFDDNWIVFIRASGGQYPITRTVSMASTFRAALMEYALDPIPAILSGHASDGAKLEVPHAAYVPLPYVSSLYATGHILGLAVILPRNIEVAYKEQVLQAIARWEDKERTPKDEETPKLRLYDGRNVDMCLRRVLGIAHAVNARTSTWCQSSRYWATVTPIALDKNPGDLHHCDHAKRKAAFERATITVAQACTHIGLDEPEIIDILTSSVVPGSTKPRHFPPFPRSRNKPRRVLVHARLRFSEPICGPVILGAGRYLGLGLCRPVDDSKKVK